MRICLTISGLTAPLGLATTAATLRRHAFCPFYRRTDERLEASA